ncbi:hypothetical protein ASPZODRAFT_150447 [Penicilliopsis zonata CBS 506.65]|uniref:Metallo-beta-lactamase domain-containing protein n=1 Tax=Penicilliopsis zonata CBS 506.65 TaxID=1073090 RepID=A0A1L9SLP0_9EURO|nr:hypothetical protein ASPZODRAFT_150447 [Penicilliopsis zonata CBS 506.65]OJJ48159.1 hypothetical protein ASPZODRAFT_150447 [Penicilliopsis zonata CBS 506.65]
MALLGLVEVDSLEALIIVDNELDPMSPAAPDTVQLSGGMGTLGMCSPHDLHDRGEAVKELRMSDICCSAHGLSVLVTATKGNVKHSILFDAGPEEEVWAKNVARLRPDLASVELIQLSHWHRDHSGGLLRAIRMIQDAKAARGASHHLTLDLHPARPDYRGFMLGEKIISLEADPSFDDLAAAGATIDKHDEVHTVLDGFFLISGEVPRVTPFEKGLKGAMRYNGQEDEWYSDEAIADERFLMCNLKGKGIVMFTGCGHAGVVNSAKHAIELANKSMPLHAVVGGFHLATSEPQQVDSTVRALKKLDPAVLLPGHCSGWRVKFAIERQIPGTLSENRLLEYFNDLFRHATDASPNCVEVNLAGGWRSFFTRDPEHVKAVLTGNFASYGKGEIFHELWSPFLGDSIFTTDGKQWSNSRQLIRPMFIKDRISDLEIFERKTQTMMSLFASPGEAFDLMDLFYRMTLDVTTEFLLGRGIHSLENPQGEFVHAFAEVQRIQMLLTVLGPIQAFIPRGAYKRGIKTIDDFVLPFVHSALALPVDELEKLSKSEKSFTFLHALAHFTRDPKVIRDQVVSVLLAGRDTTAATLSWAFYELSHYPGIYAKLRAEILSTVGPSRAPTYEDLKNMPYLRHTVNETLRLYPAVPYNIRFALTDTTLPHGGGPHGDLPLTVLQGDAVIYSTYAMQRRADLYPAVSDKFADPAVFSPERWETWTPKAWQYIPFNGGPRICIGQNFALAEIAYTMVRILQKYERLEYAGDWEAQFHKAEIVGTPGKGVNVRFNP